MSRSMWLGIAVLGLLVAVSNLVPAGEDSKDEALKKDRKLYEGKWRVVSLEINGNKGGDEDSRKITIVNGPDDTWVLRLEDRILAKGTHTLDPTKRPKEIDVLPSEGELPLEVHPGIYEIEADTRKLCLAPNGKPRPTAFESTAGSEHVLITFQREKP